MEDLGFIEKLPNGEYKMASSALSRTVFQMGDVLTVQKWYQLSFLILKKMTHIGHEDYVEVLLSAYNCFVKVQDYLHENIHRVQAIFRLFYGGFIQVIQALLGKTKIRYDPTKGSWEKHETILEEIYYALERLRMELYLKQVGNKLIEEFEGESVIELFWELQSSFKDFCIELESAKCQLTKMTALFMKYTSDWLICHRSVPVGDWAVNEVFGCKWISFWASTGKHAYLKETKRRNEALYSLPWDLLEYHRVSRFVRASDGSRCTSYDDFCEKHNSYAKQCPKDTDFEKVCLESRHLHAGQCCRKEIFSNKNRKKSRPSIRANVLVIYKFFKDVGVMQTPDVKSTVDDNTFWKRVVLDKKKPKPQWHHTHRETVNTTAHENRALHMILDKEEFTPLPNSDDSDTNSVDDEVGVRLESYSDNNLAEETAKEMEDMMLAVNSVERDQSNNTQMSIDDIREQSRRLVYGDGEVTINSSASEVNDNAQKIQSMNNTYKYELNKDCLVDYFQRGREKLANIVTERKEELDKERLDVLIIYESVKYFRRLRSQNAPQLPHDNTLLGVLKIVEPQIIVRSSYHGLL